MLNFQCNVLQPDITAFSLLADVLGSVEPAADVLGLQ